MMSSNGGDIGWRIDLAQGACLLINYYFNNHEMNSIEFATGVKKLTY